MHSMSYLDVSKIPGVVKPELYPVTRDEIDEIVSIEFPRELIDCWLQIGCGFFPETMTEGVSQTSRTVLWGQTKSSI